MTTEEKFQAAVNIIRSLPKDGPYQPSHDMMLKFYGLYKQAVEGPCTEPKPAFYEVVKGYKWQAWRALGSMTKAEAKNCYVEELKKIIETMAYTENVANFIDALGPFYEYVDVPGKKKLNNNTAKGPPSSGDLSDSCNEATESSSSGRNTPITNGVQCDTQNHHAHQQNGDATAAPALYVHAHAARPLGDVDADSAVGEEQEEEGSQEDESEDDEQGEEEEEEEGEVAGAAAAAVNKVYSDSDTDEEYSEPAEQLSTAYTDRESHNTPQPTASQEGAVMHGGGDKSHPGGLQMTPAQGYNLPNHPPGHSQLPLAFPSPSHPAHGRWGGGGSGGGGDGGGGGGGGRGGRRVADDVSAQLMVVLQRLQTDMECVLHRLNTLETLTLTQHHAVCRTCQGGSSSGGDTPGNGSGRSWWPFPELSPRSTFFLLMWPLILHGGFRLLPLLRCRRKRS
ncbi:acyl-CoA-binding domain-containing protein 5-like isoform X2 [Eriocheir sinensis]|uniref:acyl-CoA-binding domain-containing protein 5-like isoform X2 n=1 Tax=Eriocheir sinensis TaxID=95602 RepID=UPI0021C622E6|nr:acyl-CoA-binding domain-containing protein 5-like isoform X2 [Eriocheir sinensis]